MAWETVGSLLVALDAAASDNFGSGVALSKNGLVLAVGAQGWEGASGSNRGGVYIYDWSGSDWVQRGLVLEGAIDEDSFGFGLALNTDGSVLVVGAPALFGDTKGNVYVYDWSGSAWVQRGGVLIAADAAVGDRFGRSLAISADGTVLAVGNDAWEDTGSNRGGVYIYDWSGSAWVQRGSVLQAGDAADNDGFGIAVALDEDGLMLAVGASGWEGASGSNRGGVYIYDWSGSAWVQRGSVIEAADAANDDAFGYSAALSADGLILVVGAYGWEGDEGSNRGGVYVYDWSGSAWVQRDAVLEADDAANSARFSSAVALDGAGTTLVIGASGHASAASNAGAVYTYQEPPPVVLPSGLVSLRLSLQVTAQGSPELPLALIVGLPSGAPSLPLALQVTAQGSPELPLALHVVDLDDITGSASNRWQSHVTLGGVDITARLMARLCEVQASESAARIATLRLLPVAGPLDPDGYVGQAVTIDYAWGDPAQAVRLFTGLVEHVEVDLPSRVMTLRCTDDRQGVLMGTPRAVLDALIGGYWSASVFDADADGYRYAEDRLSTVAAALDLSPWGAPRLTAWAAKGSPDWTITAPLDGSTRLRIAEHSALVHQVVCTFGYRFPRLRRRRARFSYTFNLPDLWNHVIAPPDQALIDQALAATGWLLAEPTQYTRPGAYYARTSAYYLVPDADGRVLTASAVLDRRWAQTVDERLTLTVAVAEIGINAKLSRQISGALIAEFDTAAWEDDTAALPTLAAPAIGADTTQDATSDTATGRAAQQTGVRTLLHMARRILLDSHRQHELEFAVPLNPFIDLTDTIEYDLGGLNVIGKVRAVRHAMDPASGEAVTTVTLAISRPNLPVPASDSALDPPAASTAPALGAAVSASLWVYAVNRIGGLNTSPAYDEDWSGYVINIPSSIAVSGLKTSWGTSGMKAASQPAIQAGGELFTSYQASAPAVYSGDVGNPSYNAATAYTPEFRVVLPAIEDAARDRLEVPLAADYLVRVPTDVFTIA